MAYSNEQLKALETKPSFISFCTGNYKAKCLPDRIPLYLQAPAPKSIDSMLFSIWQRVLKFGKVDYNRIYKFCAIIIFVLKSPIRGRRNYLK